MTLDARPFRPSRPTPVFAVPLTRPSVPEARRIARDVERILASGVLTNGPYVRELERQAAEYLGVAHCVAVASCTTGLMLVLQAAGLHGRVVVPSFTFAATVHAVVWNSLQPVFCDIDRRTLTASPCDILAATDADTSAVLVTHTYGTPCDVEAINSVAQQRRLRVFFDAAHAFGSRHNGQPVGGFGDAEVFSLTPTKILVAGEGGIIATNDGLLAEHCRIGREYGNPGDYDCQFAGLNGRMSEFHAAMALASLEDLESRIVRRNDIVSAYRRFLGDVLGLRFPDVRTNDRSTFKDLTVMIDRDGFGLDASATGRALAARGIDTRRYYAPPVHRTRAYRQYADVRPLPVTDHVADQVLTLPLFSEMTDRDVQQVCDAVLHIHEGARRGRRGERAV